MILARSPHYLTIAWTQVAFATIPEKYIIQLYVWKGLKASVPAQPTRQLENKNPLERVGTSDVNISNYVKDILTVGLQSDTSTNVINSNSSVWVKSQVIYYIGGVAQTPYYVVTDLAIDGYGYGIEGKNTTIPTNNALTSVLSANVSSTTNYTIPIKVSETVSTAISVISYPLNTLNDSFTIAATTNSNELIKNIFVKCSEIGTDTSIQIKRNTVLIKELILKEEFRYTPIDVWFLNKFGQLDTLVFFKEKVESLSITSEKYESSIGQPINGIRQFEKYNTNGKTSYKINSGFVKESNNEIFKQLFLSNKCWEFNGTIFVPINLKSTNLEYKSKLSERLINYEAEFEYAFNELNNA